MSELLSPPELGFGVRTLCKRCDNTGAIVELRVIWKQPRAGLPPLRGSRCVADDDEGRAVLAEAKAAGYIDVEIVSAARPCECRTRPSDPAAALPALDPPKGYRPRRWSSRAEPGSTAAPARMPYKDDD